MEKLNTPYSYNDYKNLVIKHAENNGSTGEISNVRIAATKLNAQRMKRIDKQIILKKEIIETIKESEQNWIWIVLAESWCGDGAQNIPIINKIAEASNNIELIILLRDENLDLMDKYLTNGTRSVPKLICFDKTSEQEIGTWGPRPKAIQEMVKTFKTDYPDVSHDEFVKNLHLWYANDKGESFQNEFVDFIKVLTANGESLKLAAKAQRREE